MVVRRFEDLTVWQLARKFRHEIYRITAKFPRQEEFHLTAQIRSAAVSITANIAEGYGRYSYKENIQFCRVERGSVNETIDHLCTARDEGYIAEKEYQPMYQQGREVERALNGYIGYLRRELNQPFKD